MEVETYIKNFLEARREYMEVHKCNPCQIYLDTSGVKIYTNKNMNSLNVNIQNGQLLSIMNDKTFVGSSSEIGCSYKDIIKVVYPGMELQIGNDGGLNCKVKAVFEDKVEVECLNDYVLGEDQTINVPGVKKACE